MNKKLKANIKQHVKEFICRYDLLNEAKKMDLKGKMYFPTLYINFNIEAIINVVYDPKYESFVNVEWWEDKKKYTIKL